jgi:hypothetical protein
MNSVPIVLNLRCRKANNVEERIMEIKGEYLFKSNPISCFLKNISSTIGTINTGPTSLKTSIIFKSTVSRTSLLILPQSKFSKNSIGLDKSPVTTLAEIPRIIKRNIDHVSGSLKFKLILVALFLLT